MLVATWLVDVFIMTLRTVETVVRAFRRYVCICEKRARYDIVYGYDCRTLTNPLGIQRTPQHKRVICVDICIWRKYCMCMYRSSICSMMACGLGYSWLVANYSIRVDPLVPVTWAGVCLVPAIVRQLRHGLGRCDRIAVRGGPSQHLRLGYVQMMRQNVMQGDGVDLLKETLLEKEGAAHRVRNSSRR